MSTQSTLAASLGAANGLVLEAGSSAPADASSPEVVPRADVKHSKSRARTRPSMREQASARDGEQAAPPPAVSAQPGWAYRLIYAKTAASLQDEASRFGVGLGLASTYGLALGLRGEGSGIAALGAHVTGVPAAFLIAATLGVPAFYIAMALLDAPLTVGGAVRAASRSVALGGLLLAGLAPLAALYVVGAEHASSGAVVGALGLLVAGLASLGRFVSLIRAEVGPVPTRHKATVFVVFLLFGLFSVLLAARTWFGLLPLFGGGWS